MNRQAVQQRRNRLQQQHKMKQIERINQVSQGDSEIFNKIIDKPDEKLLNVNMLEMTNNYNSFVESSRKERTNNPYKCIIKDQPVREYAKKEDLVIYTVTAQDRLRERLDNDIKQYETNIKTHNNELYNTYNDNKKKEHLKSFEYNHRYKYRMTVTPGNDEDKIREESIEYFKREQERLEESNNKVQDILTHFSQPNKIRGVKTMTSIKQ